MFFERLHSFNPYGDVETNVESHAQDPVADPHGALRGSRERMAFIETSRALGQDGEPDDEDLVESHGGSGVVDVGRDVGHYGTAESIIGSPYERA